MTDSTLIFDKIPDYKQDYIAAATMAALRRFAKTEEGARILAEIKKKKGDENDGI